MIAERFGYLVAKFGVFKPFVYLHTAILRKVVGKVHATISKGIVGVFEFTVLQRNLRERHEKPWTYVC